MPIRYIKAAYRRLSCDRHSIDDERPDSPLWGTSRPNSEAYALERITAKVYGPSPLGPAARPESSTLPPSPMRPGLKPLRLPEIVKARDLYDRAYPLLPSSPTVVHSPRIESQDPRDWVVSRLAPMPEPVHLPEPVALIRYGGPGEVLFDFDTESTEALELGHAYDGCSIELQPVRPQPQLTRYDVRHTQFGRVYPLADTAPLNIVKRPLPAVVVSRPPPRASSIPKRRPSFDERYRAAHDAVIADMRAKGHPLPDLLNQAVRGHPLMVCPNVAERAADRPKRLGRPSLDPATPWPLGRLPR